MIPTLAPYHGCVVSTAESQAAAAPVFSCAKAASAASASAASKAMILKMSDVFLLFILLNFFVVATSCQRFSDGIFSVVDQHGTKIQLVLLRSKKGRKCYRRDFEQA